MPKLNHVKWRDLADDAMRQDMILRESDECNREQKSTTSHTPHLSSGFGSFESEEVYRGRTTVELLLNEDDKDLGLVVTGGIDKSTPPRVAYLKPGSVAQQNDGLEVGDSILSINGFQTAQLKHNELVHLLQTAANPIILELEYTLREPEQLSFSVLCKRIHIRLRRDENGMFGMTIRGGASPDPAKCRPLTITQIRQGGPADREGTLKVGDRILSVNGVNMAQYSLAQALDFLNVSHHSDLLFHVEYDVSVLDKLPGYILGISLREAVFRNKPVLCIDSVTPASIADRCGALHVGDHVLAIDGISLENMHAAEATKLVMSNAGNQIRLEIVPVQLVGSQTEPAPLDNITSAAESTPKPRNRNNNGSFPACGAPTKARTQIESSASVNSLASQPSHCSTSVSMTTRAGSASHSSCDTLKERTQQSWDSLPNINSSTTLSYHQAQVCHVDTTEVVLVASHRSFGLTIDAPPTADGTARRNTDILTEPPIITSIQPKGPAERCGVLQEGDRVLAINGQFLEGRTLDEIHEFIRTSGVKMLLLVEFNVAESIIPSSGVFVVKFVKRGSGLGLTISCPRNRRPGQHLVITEIKKGSITHRTGTIQPGDQLLAINNVPLDNCTLEDSARVLQDAHNIVKLMIKKDEHFADEPDPTHLITYTVELPKFAGPLGIVISGSEEPFDPVFISSLSDGGLAEKTGALHVGDRLLAINGVSLRGKTLTDAVQLLQNAGQTVMLKITRPASKLGTQTSTVGKCHDSMDSALESWDSSRSRTNDQRPFDGSSNGSNPSNNTTDSNSVSRRLINGAITQINCEKWASGVTTGTVSPPRSFCSSAGGVTGGVDEWSRRLDDLDQLKPPDIDDVPDSYSDLPDIEEITSDDRLIDQYEIGTVKRRCSDDQTLYDPEAPGDCFDDVTAADIHLREVEEQLQNIFTPTPIELMKVTLLKECEIDDFGFSVCDGVFEKGVYVGAIRPNGPAADVLKPYDRVLQVNLISTRELDCCQVVPLIAQTGNQVDLVISRNPLVWGLQPSQRAIFNNSLHNKSTCSLWQAQGTYQGRAQDIESSSNTVSDDLRCVRKQANTSKLRFL